MSNLFRPILQPVLRPLTVAILDWIDASFNLFADIINDAGELAPYVTFTRSSTATRYNSAGLLETVAVNAPRYDYDPTTVTRVNLLRYSQEFDNAVWGKATASITANTIAAPDGTMTADTLTATSATGYIAQIVGTADTFTLSVWIKRKTGTGNVSLVIRPGFQESVVAVTNDWVRYTYTAASTYSNVGVRLATSGDEVYIWGAQLETGSTATAYIPTGASPAGNATLRGLLIEEQRTNLLVHSDQFDNASWTKNTVGLASAPIVTANAAVAPDGTTSADKVVFVAPASGDFSELSQMATVSAGTYAGSFYVKADSAGDIGKIIAFRHVSGGAYLLVTLSSTWQRIQRAETQVANTFEIALRPAVGTSSGTVSVQLWGAQLEAGAFATSYIPTTTAAVTRAADTASVTNLANIGYNALEGAVYSESTCFGTETGKYLPVFRFGTSTDRIDAFYAELTGVGHATRVGGVSQAQATVPHGGASNRFRGSRAYKQSDSALAYNGNAAASMTGGTGLLPSVSALYIGATEASLRLNGHIRRLRYYARRLSNAELQALTS